MSEIRNLTRNGETFYPLTCTEGLVNRDGNVVGEINDIFDISEYNASGTPSVLAKYDNLSLALAAVPTSKQKGGMTIRYVQTSDNKYVQYRLMSDTFNTTPANWQGVDTIPTYGSHNFVESGGVFDAAGIEKYSATTRQIGNILFLMYLDPHKKIKEDTIVLVKEYDYDSSPVMKITLTDLSQQVEYQTMNVIDGTTTYYEIPAGYEVNNIYYQGSGLEGKKANVYFIPKSVINEFNNDVKDEINTKVPIGINGKNLFEDDKIVPTKLIFYQQTVGSTIALSEASNAAMIKIPVKPNTNYTVSAKNWCGASYVAITDSSDILLNWSMTAGNKTIESPANGAYLYLNIKISGSESVDVQIEEGTAVSPYEKTSHGVKMGYIPPVLIDYANCLYGKKAVFFGDSITEGYGQYGVYTKYGWATPISVNYNMQCVNEGYGGAKIADQIVDGQNISIRARFENWVNAQNEADYYIIEGGFNDSNFGSLVDGWPSVGNFDTDNAVQALEEICAFCSTRLAGKKYGFIICYGIGNPIWANTRAAALISALEKWGMPYIDLRKNAGFTLTSYEECAIYGVDRTNAIEAYNSTAGYYRGKPAKYNNVIYEAKEEIPAPAGDFDITKWNEVGAHYYDSMHCNRFAYDILAPKIANWMQTL